LKSKKEIRDKTFQVMERCLKESKKELLSRKVTNCVNSGQIKAYGGSDGNYCKYQMLCNGMVQVCDDERASGCDMFECQNSSASVKREFKETILNPALCGEKYPKLSALLWVLGGDLKNEENKVDKQPTLKERFKLWLNHIIA
jgi:hypothetical protein